MRRSMRNYALLAIVTAICLICPLMGCVSWHYVQSGDWLAAYVSAGVSWVSPIAAWWVVGLID